MLKKLRIRLVCVIMLIVVLIFASAFAAIGLATRRSLDEEAETMMRSVASQPLQGFGFGRDRERISLPYFLLEISGGTIFSVSSGSGFDLSDEEELLALLETVNASDRESGYLKDYGLRYLKQETPFGYKVVFTDTSSQQATMQNLVRTMFFIGILVFAFFLLIAILFARWAVKPVEEAWQQQKQFISDASHELKTPLTVITTNAELLSSGDCTPEDQTRYAGNISAVSHQMRTLVEDLLNLARLDNGTEKASYTDVDLSRVVSDGLLPFEPIFFEKGLELSEDVEAGLHVHGSESRLKQLLDILLDNAQKYSDPGKVSVSLKKSQRSAILTVAGPGRALTPAQREDIFKRFYRADEARSEKGSYGLGLPIARSIAEAHGGKLVCESEDGQNRFIATLPLR